MSAPYLGDFPEDATLHHIWSTNDSNGASVTRATDGTVSVYKDNGVAQSVAGITDTEDFDSLTGIHVLTIDLSADAFYVIGSNYSVVLSAATIDGRVVNAVLCHFSIENRYINEAVINAQVASVLKTDTMTQSALAPQEAPPLNPTFEEALAYLYKAWRNRTTQTTTEYSLFADNGTTQDHKATVSDDGSTFVRGEVEAGT